MEDVDDFVSEEGEDLGAEDDEDPGFPSLNQYPAEVILRVMQLLVIANRENFDNPNN